MPIYEEKIPGKFKSSLLLLFAFFAIYSPLQLGQWELRWREDRYAAIAAESELLKPNTLAHGEHVISTHPFFPWITAILHKFSGISFEFSMRLISILSIAVIAILVWESGRRTKGIQAAVAGATMFISSLVVVEKGMDGYPDMTGLLFIFSAWLSWFLYGVARGQWNRAWLSSILFCMLSFYTIGWLAPIYYFIPLIFMRRPMTVWPKLTKPGFYIGVTMFIAFIFLRWGLEGINPFTNFTLQDNIFHNYIHHIFTYPFDLFFRFLPWGIFLWPAFCVAYFPMDKTPIFSRFLRTITISLFFFLWISPNTKARDFIVIAPSLSILFGLNYWILVRRYGDTINKFIKILIYLSTLVALSIIIFYLLPDSILSGTPYMDTKLTFRKSNLYFGLIQSGLALFIGIITIYKSRKKIKVSTHILSLSTILAICFWALLMPYRAANKDKKNLGHTLAMEIKNDLKISQDTPFPKNLTVYKGPLIKSFYAPCIYMGAKVKKIHSFDELPQSSNKIYVIVSKFPVSTKYSWEYVTKDNPHIYRKEKLFILKGIRIPEKNKKDKAKK